MDAKDLRIERDGSKYAQSGTALQCNRNKSYQDIGSNPSPKVDAPNARPCAVIGPDRVVPPIEPNDAYLKKAQVEPWPCPETVYHRPPEYPLKPSAYHNPTRNISPRQTFQENMQRIMVPPTYNSVKTNEDAGVIQKLSVTSDAKYCDVPYSLNPSANEPRNIRSAEMCLPNVNSALGRAPLGWAPGGINVRPQRPYISSDMYQYPDYPSCAGPRPVSISRPHRPIPEESGYMYPENYYQEPNIRFKPYPNVKERYPQARYDYVTNYSNPFHPPPCPQKYEISKALPPHPYTGYPHFKYIDSRMPETILEGYQRPVGQQGSYNMTYRNPIVHPAYGPVMSNHSQSKISPYPPDTSFKAIASNKLPYDSNGKIYVEYDNARTKPLPSSESFYANEMSRHHTIPKGTMPNYTSINMHSLPPHYKKDNPQLKNYEYVHHYKNLLPSINMNNPMQRLIPQFSPNAIAISPTDSNTSNDTLQTHSTSQEDCGYVSQSSTTSLRSIDLGNSRIPNDYYGRYYDPRYGPVIRTAPPLSKTNRNTNSKSADNKDKKDMDVRKFLQMWNEGDDDNTENISTKEITVQNNLNEHSNPTKTHGDMNNQGQLYVLGSVHVPSEDLSKYEHIQKVSKLPENIKGYNSIELLNQFEEVIESSNMNGFKLPTYKEFQAPTKQCAPKQSIAMLPRPLSPLDVEAKISQSVIHKEVGCNFEIKPCSPKMLNVEIASPVQNILNERVIEKVTNPLSMITAPILNGIDNMEHCIIPDARQDQRSLKDPDEISSCKMINTQFSNPTTHLIKTNYSIQDLESNAGVCLASLPRLDNDIELNFPEVNQQFINANKGESIMSTQLKDLPELNELDQTGKTLNNVKPEKNDTSALSPKVETEREFTKLSKYRKMKANTSDARLEKSALKAIRTDSVIIKNPENAKALEIDQEQYPINKIKQIDQPICTNLTSQVDFIDDKIPSTHISNETEANDIAPASVLVDNIPETNILNESVVNNVASDSQEMAIDFRLHKDTDKHFELNINTPKHDESLQFSKTEELLNKSHLYKKKDDVSKYPEINKLGVNNKEISSNISSAEKYTENNTTKIPNKISSPLDIGSCQSSYETEDLGVPDIINQSNVFPNSPHSPEKITNYQNTSENEILGLPLPIENIDKTIVQTFNNSHRETLPEIQVNSPNNIEIKNEIKEVVTCDASYEQSNIIKPAEDAKKSDSIDVPESDIIKEVSEHILQNESTIQSPTIKINEEQENSSEIQGSVENNYETIPEQLEQNLHTESLEPCDFKLNTEITDMSNLDEGFVSIDEQQNCDKIAVSNYDIDTDAGLKNDVNVEEICKPMRYATKCYGYGSKELYSPWIQNLIMFDEGVCCTLCCDKNKTSLVKVDSLLDVLRLSDINRAKCSSKESDGSTDISDSTVCESTLNNINSDSTLSCDNNLQTKTNALLSPPCCKLLNVQFKNDEECFGIQDKHSQSIKSDEDLNDNENGAKDETVKGLLICEQDENTNIITASDTDICRKNEETYSYHELDIKKQSIDPHDDKIEKEENKSKIVPTKGTTKHRISLKRSLSDSALNLLHSESQPAEREEFSVVWPFKRSKLVDTTNEPEMIAQNLCNILQHNRRNSISAVYNEDVSFCILIEDNSMLTEENDEKDKLCYTEISEDCLNEINKTYTCEENIVNVTSESVTCNDETNCEYSNTITLSSDHDIALDGTWVEDVACMETVVSDDIAEDIVVSCVSTSKENNFWDDGESNNYVNSGKEDDAVAASPKYDKIIHSDQEILNLCEMTQIDVDETLIPKESQSKGMFLGLYDSESLEKILSESNSQDGLPHDGTECVRLSESPKYLFTPYDKENLDIILSESNTKGKCFNEIDNKINQGHSSLKTYEKMPDVMVHSCESSIDNVFSNNHRDNASNYTSSSPEVSSTTEEKSLLLKISNYKGTKISQINTFKPNTKISCKLTEKTDYVNQNIKLNSNRPLLTKAAQKYIPPIKESIRDLKVKLSLPQHSLLKLRQIKMSKDEPKLNKQITMPSRLPKKPKPKFEDVLKSIDEIQIKMHKEKTKKVKKSIPKVVIKKNENGCHYASTSNKDTFNPDLTGRKWQPWVFLEKNYFIDKMATRRKTKAIFSHRKNMYVLAEKFHKYKSASSTKFVISHPKLSDLSSGQLKYTIRLKHSY